MNRREQLKKEVMASMVEHLRSARAAGLNLFDEVECAFPSVPAHLRAEAVFELECEEEEAWWDRLERTIDGEVLSRAIGRPSGGAS